MNKKVLSFTLVLSFTVATYAQNIVPMHNEKGLFGYGERGSKTFTIKPQWDEARPFNEHGVAIVRKGQMFGLIDKRGKAIGKSLGYSVIVPYDGTNYWLVALGGKYTDKIIKSKGPFPPFVQGFRGSKSYNVKGAKWGLMTTDGRYVLEPKYNAISYMRDGMIAVVKGQYYGYINSNGKEVYPTKAYAVSPFNSLGYAYVISKQNKASIIDKTGKVIISEKENVRYFTTFKDYGNCSPEFLNEDSLMSNKALWNDSLHNMPIAKMYWTPQKKYYGFTWNNTSIPYFHATKGKDKKKRVVIYDLKGNQIISDDADITSVFAPSENLCFAKKSGKWGFYNISTKQFTILDQNRTYYPVHAGVSLSFRDRKYDDYYFVDTSGKKVSGSYDKVIIAGNCFITRRGNAYGLISKQGKEIVPTECLNVLDANGGLFGIKASNGKFGYIDENGNTVVPIIYDDGSAFVGDYAVVSKAPEGSSAKKSGVIDKSNNVIVPLNYDNVCGYVDNDGKIQVWVAKGGKYSKVDNASIGGFSSLRLSATDYTDMRNTPIGVVVKNTKGLYGLLQNDKIVIPCSVASDELVGRVYQFMASRNITEISAVDARRIAAWTNDMRNTFKLQDTIGDNIWDF